jgi:hypothetical protein
MVDETGIYIADSLNHLIRKYDFKTKQIKTLSGSKEFGNLIGNSTKYFEPSDLVSILDRLYIVDSSNNRIVILNRSNISSKIYNLMPKQKLYKETLLQYMPNLKKSKDVKISAINNKITINVKDGWKINEEGPSFINLINLVGKNRAKLVANFDWKEVLKREILLPNLKNSNDYVVQGVIYYCEDKKNALCYIENYEQTLQVSDEFSNEEGININIPNLKKEI